MTSIDMKVLVLAAVIAAAVPAASASAATLVGTGTTSSDGAVTFTSHARAADLVIGPAFSYDQTITEMGSRLNVSGPNCTVVDDHDANCLLADAVVDLRGGDDTAKVADWGRMTVNGGAGDGRIDADGTSTRVDGGGGNDLILGNSDSQTMLDGGPGADTIYGAGTGNLVTGDDGKDTIITNTASPNVDGGDGADTLITVHAVPTGGTWGSLHGGNGNDVIVTELADTKYQIASGSYDGGAGNDVIDVTRDGAGRDDVTCGDGNDTVYADRDDIVAADCETVVLGAPPAGSPAADAVAEGQAFLAALRTITWTPGPLLPGW